MKRLLIAAAAFLIASPALAGQAVTLKAQTLDADGIVTHSFDLNDAVAAYDAVRDRLGVKIAVTP